MNSAVFPADGPHAAGPTSRNRLRSAEDEPIEHLLGCREGRRILAFCRKLAGVLEAIASTERDVPALHRKLSATLASNLQCTPTQADGLIELSLEILHSGGRTHLRRSKRDLAPLIALARESKSGESP